MGGTICRELALRRPRAARAPTSAPSVRQVCAKCVFITNGLALDAAASARLGGWAAGRLLQVTRVCVWHVLLLLWMCGSVGEYALCENDWCGRGSRRLSCAMWGGSAICPELAVVVSLS